MRSYHTFVLVSFLITCSFSSLGQSFDYSTKSIFRGGLPGLGIGLEVDDYHDTLTYYLIITVSQKKIIESISNFEWRGKEEVVIHFTDTTIAFIGWVPRDRYDTAGGHDAGYPTKNYPAVLVTDPELLEFILENKIVEIEFLSDSLKISSNVYNNHLRTEIKKMKRRIKKYKASQEGDT